MKGKVNKIQISCFGVLNVVIFLAFFLAKIFDKIDWSWFWVFSPLWIPFAIIALIVVIVGVIYVGAMLIGAMLTLWK